MVRNCWGQVRAMTAILRTLILALGSKAAGAAIPINLLFFKSRLALPDAYRPLSPSDRDTTIWVKHECRLLQFLVLRDFVSHAADYAWVDAATVGTGCIKIETALSSKVLIWEQNPCPRRFIIFFGFGQSLYSITQTFAGFAPFHVHPDSGRGTLSDIRKLDVHYKIRAPIIKIEVIHKLEIVGCDPRPLVSHHGRMADPISLCDQFHLFLASAPQLESGPRQPAGYDHQSIGEKHQRDIGRLRLAEKFDNPTVGFAVFVGGLIVSFSFFCLGLNQYERGR